MIRGGRRRAARAISLGRQHCVRTAHCQPEGDRVTGIVEAERGGIDDERVAEGRVASGWCAAAEDDDRTSGGEHRGSGESEANVGGVGDGDARQINRRVGVVEQFDELIIVAIAHAVAVGIALQVSRRTARRVGEELVNHDRHLNAQQRLSGDNAARAVGRGCRDLHCADADAARETGVADARDGCVV